MDWFLYNRDLRHERVKIIFCQHSKIDSTTVFTTVEWIAGSLFFQTIISIHTFFKQKTIFFFNFLKIIWTVWTQKVKTTYLLTARSCKNKNHWWIITHVSKSYPPSKQILLFRHSSVRLLLNIRLLYNSLSSFLFVNKPIGQIINKRQKNSKRNF